MKKLNLLKATALSILACASSIAINGYSEERFEFGKAEVAPSCVDLCSLEKGERSSRVCPILCEAREEFCDSQGGTYKFEAEKDAYVCDSIKNVAKN